MEQKIRIWKIIRLICIILLGMFAGYLIYRAIKCMGYQYPMPMMGVDAMNWTEAFFMELVFTMIIAGIPAAAVLIMLILSFIMIKRIRSAHDGENSDSP